MNDIDRLESDVEELQSRMYSVEDRVGQPPYYLVAWFGRERKYIGVFYTDRDARDFVNSCRLKTKYHSFKKKSPLYNSSHWSIERFYIPEHIPVEPTFEG